MTCATRNSVHAERRRGGLTAQEVAYADMARANRMPWFAIANQLGRSEHDVRSACDTDYEGRGR